MAQRSSGFCTRTPRRDHRLAIIAAGLMIPMGSAYLLPSYLAARADEPKVHADGPLPTTRIYLHKNGSVTITVAGVEHKLGPLEYGKQGKELLKGQSAVLFEMEDWKNFERAAGERLPVLQAAGVKSITLKITEKGKIQYRTQQFQPPRLEQRIVDRNPSVRAAALDEIEAMLKSDKPSARINAMAAIRSSQNVRYDRKRFLPHVRRILQEARQGEIGQAIGTIGVVGGDAADLPLVLVHLDDADNRIRVEIPAALYGLDPEAKDPRIGPAIEKLLADPASWVRVTTFKELWGKPTTAGVDAKLIEMSRGPSKGGSSEADEVVYHALSTRPLISKAVAERLIELYRDKNLYAGRAVWGLAHSASDDAKPIIVDALIHVIDMEVDRETRWDAIRGLSLHGGDKAIQKLKEIATSVSEWCETREYARRYIPESDRPQSLGALTTVVNSGQREVLKELWRQIVQPQDPALRKSALETVEQKLENEDSAAEALQALVRSREADFDRSRFIPLIKPLRTNKDPKVRALALAALVTAAPAASGKAAIDISTVADAASDPSPIVRQIVAETIRYLDPKAGHPRTSKTIEALLADEDSSVVRSTIHALWSFPTSPEVEASLIELSFHTDLGYDTVYYALSTRPLIRKPVAQRLIELSSSSNESGGRATWGLSHFPIADDAKDIVTAAFIEIIDNTADGYDRSNAIHGLGALKTASGRRRLQGILDSPSESPAAKNSANSALASFDASNR